MRMLGLAGLLLVSAGQASAQEATPAPLPSDRICTVTTTVVRRGDAILSSNTTTRCEAGPTPSKAAEPGGESAGAGASPGGGGFHPPNPVAILGGVHPGDAVKSITSNRKLKPRDLWGNWTVEKGSRRVCRVSLWAKGVGEVRPFQTTGCEGLVTQATLWMMADDGVTLRDPKGVVIVELNGSADRLTGKTAAGESVALTR